MNVYETAEKNGFRCYHSSRQGDHYRSRRKEHGGLTLILCHLHASVYRKRTKEEIERDVFHRKGSALVTEIPYDKGEDLIDFLACYKPMI